MFKKNSSRSGLFLLELIISILFFSMASAVCIRLFVQAHVIIVTTAVLRSPSNSVKILRKSIPPPAAILMLLWKSIRISDAMSAQRSISRPGAICHRCIRWKVRQSPVFCVPPIRRPPRLQKPTVSMRMILRRTRTARTPTILCLGDMPYRTC